jgi:hypothetical protein
LERITWLIFLKENLLAGEIGVRKFSKPGEGFFFLMKIVGAVLPPPAEFY